MKIDLNIEAGEKQRNFLDYFNAGLRTKLNWSNGSFNGNEDGTFESRVNGLFPYGLGACAVEWKIVKDNSDNLKHIEVTCLVEIPEKSDVEKAALEFVVSVLSATLSEKKETYFRRSLFYYIGSQLDGEYWLPGFRIAPSDIQDENPHLMNAERPLIIDQEIQAIDDMHATSIADYRARQMAARLSLLLNSSIYKSNSIMVNVISNPKEGEELKSLRLSQGYIISGPAINKMPAKGELYPLGKYSGSLTQRFRIAGELLSLPKEARKILRSIENSSPNVKNAFDCCARLYQVACFAQYQYPSVGLSYRVAAVEAIVKAITPQSNYSDFMKKYVKSIPDIDELLDYLYGNVRSGHFHSGSFPLGEFERHYFFDPLMDIESQKQDWLNRISFEISREAIVNWIISLLPNDDKEE